jgi:hypothetical protein
LAYDRLAFSGLLFIWHLGRVQNVNIRACPLLLSLLLALGVLRFDPPWALGVGVFVFACKGR